MVFTPLLNNVALLIALSAVHALLLRWLSRTSLRYRILSGLLFGGVAMVGMVNAVPVTEGVFFDGRSVILSIAGAFGGPAPAIIAGVLAGAYRLSLGGAGVTMGVLTVLNSAMLGIVLYYLRQRHAWASSRMAFLVLGFTVHMAMLFFSVTLPGPVTLEVLPEILLPVMTIYPLGTLLLAVLFREQEKHSFLTDKLFDSEERFRQVFENSAAVHMLLDPADGRIVDANLAAQEFYGWSIEQLRGMNIREINSLTPEEQKKEMEAADSGHKKVFHLQHRLASGDIRLVEVHAGPIGYGKNQLLFTIVHDVTEQRLHQEQLKRERLLLRTVIDNIPDTVYVKDSNLRKTLANRAELEILGKSEEEVIGKTDRDLYPLKEAEGFEADDLRVVRQGETILNREEKIVSPDGTISWLLTSKTPLMTDDGKIIGLVGIGRNINERVDALKQLTEAKEQAEAANRAKSEFLANMSHEIRTPMNAILGFSEALYHRMQEPENKKMLQSVLSSGNLLLGLLNDILDLSKIESGMLKISPQPMDLIRHLEDIRMLYQEKADSRGLELILETPQDFPEKLILDEVRIKQVIFNLVGNAVKFTHKGAVRIGVSFSASDDQSGELRLWVKDSGIGIPPDQLDLIFKPFYQQSGQSDRKYGGTGLGLAISLRLVERMNGRLEVESKPGGGSTFTMVLPSVPVSLAWTTRKPQTGQSVRTMFRDATVLIVDDAPANLEMLEINMESFGLKSLKAESGKQALEILKEHKPDIALIDILMPEMDGFQLAGAIRKDPLHRDMPLVAFTALVNEPKKIEHSGLFDAALYKPVRRASLLAVLEQHLDHSHVDVALSHPAEPDNKFQPEAIPEMNLGDSARKRLPELVRRLESDLLPRWESIKDQWVLFKIEILAGDLKALGEEFGVPLLAAYGEKMGREADNLDLETLRDHMQYFPAIVEKLRSLQT